jgi:hypothetical protein
MLTKARDLLKFQTDDFGFDIDGKLADHHAVLETIGTSHRGAPSM